MILGHYYPLTMQLFIIAHLNEQTKLQNSCLKGASTNKKWLRYGCKENFLQDILTHKVPKKNLILIAHSGCIKRLGEAEGHKLINMEIDEKTYAITIFMAIDEFTKQPHVLGYLFPNYWRKAIDIYAQKTPIN